MSYRFMTVLFPSVAPFPVEHDLFDYTVSALKWSYEILATYSDLHLPSNLSRACMTCFRDLVGLAIIRMIVSYFQAARRTSFKELKADAIASIFDFAKNFSVVKKELQKEEVRGSKERRAAGAKRQQKHETSFLHI